MATCSHLLPQALHMIPRIPTKNLGVSSFQPRASSVNSRISVSRVLLNHSGAIDSRKRREFIAKAEESTEGGETEADVEDVAETVETADVEDVAETVETAEVEEAKPPWKPRTKLGDVMGILNQKAIEVSEKVRPVPEIRTGDIVEIKLEVPENRRRLSIYKGIVMSRQNAGIHTTIRIRRIIAGIGVEIVFPIYSPNIKEIKVVSHRKITRYPIISKIISPIKTCHVSVLIPSLSLNTRVTFRLPLFFPELTGGNRTELSFESEMSGVGENQLISIQPDELKFLFELEKQSYCDLKVSNKTDNYVAFKVKTTSPKKYFVRPNTGVIQPWDSCIIRVTLQAQREYPPDMQCKDKFLLQSTTVPPHTDVDELPQDTFTKDSSKTLTECKLKVSYIPTSTTQRSSESGATSGDGNGSESISVTTVQRLKEERDAAVKQTQQLQHEVEMLKKRRRNSENGLSLKLAAMVGLIGLIIGFILKLTLASSPT